MPSGHSHSSHSSSHSSHSSSHSHSSHSSSSHSSHSSHSGSSHFGSSGGSYYRWPERPRRNQPVGRHPVRTYACRHHTYHYYDGDWTYGGTAYRKGYYDEDGNYYASMNIKNNRTGKSVVCVECEYCGTQKLIELKAGQELICDACGAPLDLSRIPSDEEEDIQKKAAALTGRLIMLAMFLIIAATLIFTVAGNLFFKSRSRSYFYDYTAYSDTAAEEEDNTDIWGTRVFLKEIEDGRYGISTSTDFDKYMVWDSSEDSYYDYTSGCYVWYNTEVTPNLWQYWFDGISTDYEDAGYGWMEYEDGVWYMETAEGEWTDITDQYDTSGLWHIDNEFDYE